MNPKFVNVIEVFTHAATNHNVVLLDNKEYEVKRTYHGWELLGHGCDDELIWDYSLTFGGDFYNRFKRIEYFG